MGVVGLLEGLPLHLAAVFGPLVVADEPDVEFVVEGGADSLIVGVLDDEALEQAAEEGVEGEGAEMAVLLPHTHHHVVFLQPHCGVAHELVLVQRFEH